MNRGHYDYDYDLSDCDEYEDYPFENLVNNLIVPETDEDRDRFWLQGHRYHLSWAVFKHLSSTFSFFELMMW